MTLNFVHRRSTKQRTFLWKKLRKYGHQKLVPDPFLILVNNPKQQHARNSFENKIF